MPPEPGHTPPGISGGADDGGEPAPGLLKRLRSRLYVILEAGRTSDWPSQVFDFFMVSLILANAAAFALETVVSLAAAYGPFFKIFNLVSVLIFTIEYAARLWVCVEHSEHEEMPSWRIRLQFARTWPMLIDLAVVLPFWLGIFVPLDLRFLRVFRLIRFLKLGRYSPALSSLARVLYNERHAITGALIIMGGLLLLSATVMYELEKDVQPEVFGSVPAAMWWALATLTTVGYGDVVPVTVLGKIAGGMVMIFGLGMFALPIAIVSAGFAQEIHRREFVVTWGMVARVPLFSKFDALTIARLAEHLNARVVEAGTVIARKGEEADAMYFLLSGEVQLDFPDGPIKLEDGAFFGEMALLYQRRRAATITALTRCSLLTLQSEDFARFMRGHPDVRNTVAQIAERRLTELRQRSEAEAERQEAERAQEAHPASE
ncbi:cyclic nucleotide-gated ion channel [Parvibaculum sp.]|uniref:cyclic nucleotide-gated ion channel n=1 Tax=Parvibaculum sp. TaxID=2024848 RepID=UPI0025DBAB6C|nr:cyclic nucleotide-gated ion channel [Parvibaculum sp.]